MACFQETFTLSTSAHHQVIDLTADVARLVRKSGVDAGQCIIYTPHATAAVTVNENADPNIGVDLMNALEKVIIEHDGWLHDRIDNNAAAHIKSAIIGPSVTIPIADGQMTLGTWQNIFLCEFDGPRRRRSVIVSILS